MTPKYKIIRFSYAGRRRVVRRNLTLEDAQRICSAPESSSRYLQPNDPRGWFYGYERQT